MTELTTKAALADLRGFLHALAWVNAKCNHEYSFDIHLLKKPEGLQAALEHHFAGRASAIRVDPLEHWRLDVAEALPRWLLAYLCDPAIIGRLTDRTNTFSLSHDTFRNVFVELVLAKLEKIIKIEKAWRICITETRHYECNWVDYALESRSRVVILHLGVSD